MRIVLKRAFSDGTVAVEMDPLSLLCRLATSVPLPRYHTVKYAGVLASASKWRARIAPTPPVVDVAGPVDATEEPPVPARRGCGYRPWAELLRRTFSIDVLECPKCKGRMKLVAMITDASSIRRFLASTDEPLDAPTRSPNPGAAVLAKHDAAPQSARRRGAAVADVLAFVYRLRGRKVFG